MVLCPESKLLHSELLLSDPRPIKINRKEITKSQQASNQNKIIIQSLLNDFHLLFSILVLCALNLTHLFLQQFHSLCVQSLMFQVKTQQQDCQVKTANKTANKMLMLMRCACTTPVKAKQSGLQDTHYFICQEIVKQFNFLFAHECIIFTAELSADANA